MKPLLKSFYARIVKRDGWEGRYGRELKRLERMNSFPDLKDV
jgi:anaerobic magnesium-protoporphyrin IX monomethyl ester cyclase